MNRLASESSLYLKQHANNPVEWFPWGAEALALAKQLDRPIFLSVGYSACHWCHVMEHECFESEAIARQMNEQFVNIKVDREERPDLDQIYMTAHHVLNRGEGGGWPLSVFLTPGGEPFYAGTYFPPDERYAPSRPSFPRLLTALSNAWQAQRAELERVAGSVAGFLAESDESGGAGASIPGPEVFAGVLPGLKRGYDATFGGFGHAPKFPHAADLNLLLRLHHRKPSTEAVEMVTHTLTMMARGGMYDQLGGGFHRYSVDEKWLVPHFEKMLYDNALLPPVYAEAFQLTGDPFYKQIAAETLDYLLREMQSPTGGFYSTQDADSEGVEGKFFVWSLAEIESLLPDQQLADIAVRTYGVTERGNFEHANILFRHRSDADDAKRFGLGVGEFRERLAEVRAKLYAERANRVWPGRDEKMLTAWNGLAVHALAFSGAALDIPRFIEAAKRAADFVLAALRTPEGRLLRTCGDDSPAKLPGFLDDYAYLAHGLVTLYEATGEGQYLTAAGELADAALRHFAAPGGGFYYTPDDGETLIARSRDQHDNATPSASAVLTVTLERLAALSGANRWRDASRATLRAGAGQLSDNPMAAATLLGALDWELGPREEVAIVLGTDAAANEVALAAVRGQYHPRRVVAVGRAGGEPGCELLRGRPAVGGEVTAYVCQEFACQAPLVGAEAIREHFRPGRAP